jgi:hypothetical protein
MLFLALTGILGKGGAIGSSVAVWFLLQNS